eukprot:g3464.t1
MKKTTEKTNLSHEGRELDYAEWNAQKKRDSKENKLRESLRADGKHKNKLRKRRTQAEQKVEKRNVSKKTKGETLKESEESEIENLNDVDMESIKTRDTSFRSILGETLESTPVQAFVGFLILLDVAAAVIAESIDMGVQFGLSTQKFNILNQSTNIILQVTLCGFVSELSLLCMCFNYRVLKHPGYVIDTLVVGLSLYTYAFGLNHIIRVIGIVRLWRGMRLFWRQIGAKDAIISKLENELEEAREENAQMRLLLDQRVENVAKENDARKQVETMMKKYKNEVEMLREALQIAAETVAKATKDEGEVIGKERDNRRIGRTIVVGESGAYSAKSVR